MPTFLPHIISVGQAALKSPPGSSLLKEPSQLLRAAPVWPGSWASHNPPLTSQAISLIIEMWRC